MVLLQAELLDYLRRHGDRFSAELQEPFTVYLRYLAECGESPESAVRILMEKQPAGEQRTWLEDRLFEVYRDALRHGRETSLGSREQLLKNALELGMKGLDAAESEPERHRAVERIVNLYVAAQATKLADVQTAARDFAFVKLPEVLKLQATMYGQTASLPAALLTSLTADHRYGYRYAIERFEQWPADAQKLSERSSTFSHVPWEQLTRAEQTDAELKELQARYVKLVVLRFKDEFGGETVSHYVRTYYGTRPKWSGLTDAITTAAEEVYRQKKGSGRHVAALAGDLVGDFQLTKRAIEMLLAAEREGLLDQHAQQRLVRLLREEGRQAEAIPIMERIIEAEPDVMPWRTELFGLYGRPEKVASEVAAVAAHFHRKGRWNDVNIAEFAETCRQMNLPDKALEYFREAISLRRRARADRGGHDAQLPDWLDSVARIETTKGRTYEAVEAALGASVCWNGHEDQHRLTIRLLEEILDLSPDLDGYVRRRDEEAAKSGQDSPLLRKSIGAVYLKREKYEQAIAQLLIARSFGTNDKEISESLITAYDALGRPADGTAELLARIDFDRHDLQAYEQLALRLQEDKGEAERAATSLVEAGPTEAENHRALAELREKDGRLNDAAGEWNEVAELRRLEPAGLLGLADVQIRLKQWADARRTLDRLQSSKWPERFSPELGRIDRLRASLPR